MATTGFTRTRSEEGTVARLAGLTAIIAGLVMFVGSGIWLASGTNIDVALETGDIAGYLVSASGQTLLTAALGVWIAGVALLGIAGILLTRLGDRDSPAAAVASFAFTAGPAAAIVVDCLWLGLVLDLAPAHEAGQPVAAVALALAQAISLADWIGMVVILGLGGAMIALAGRDRWVPRWLMVWAGLCAGAGLLTLVALMLDMRTSLALPILPVGLGFMIAAGFTAQRQRP